MYEVHFMTLPFYPQMFYFEALNLREIVQYIIFKPNMKGVKCSTKT